MTENWFLQDIEHRLKRRNRVVLLDPKNLCGFLLPYAHKKGYQVLATDKDLHERWQMVKEELGLRRQLETECKDQTVIIHVTREQEQLSFLFDYCFTHGCLDLSNPAEWLRNKLFSFTGLQVQMDTSMLLTAAKLGIGKDLNWWKKIIQEPGLMVEPEEILLPFLHNPTEFMKPLDADVRRLFESKFYEIINQPYIEKSPDILAREFTRFGWR